MKYINKNQLAFVLDIKVEDARAKMCAAWCKAKGIEPEQTIAGPRTAKASRDEKKKIKDPYPLVMEVAMIAEFANLPDLAFACNDIENNYLKRPASRKYILADYPDKVMAKQRSEGKPFNLKLPPALVAMINLADQRTIDQEWRKRYPEAYKQPDPTTAP